MAVKPNGQVLPCCRFQSHLNSNNNWGELSNTDDFRNSTAWKNLRANMLAGKPNIECSKCYEEESRGWDSLRTSNLDQLPDNLTNESSELTFLEMAFSNLCNLACVSCSVTFSSKWGTEDYKFKRSNSSSLVEHNVNFGNLSHVTTLKIIGGEPFMEQKKFIELLNKFNLSKLSLMIFTNGTILPTEPLKQLMDQCKKLTIFVSLDGIESVDEWYRWPTKFNTVNETMTQYENWWGNKNNVKLCTQTVINIFNIWQLDKIVNFISNRKNTWTMSFSWIIQPGWQRISNLPESAKLELTTKLKEWQNKAPVVWYQSLGNPFDISITKLNEKNYVDWQDVKVKTLSLAQERNLDVLAMVPEMEPLFTESP